MHSKFNNIYMKKIKLLISQMNDFQDKTTKLEKIYLGNWCFKEKYIKENETVVSYHWDNREKLKKDYEYLNNVYEKTLRDLKDFLNNYHKKNYSLRFWKILTGYWLHCYLATVFDRWENIKQAFKEYPNIDIVEIYYDKNLIVSENTREFMNLVSDERWNQNLYYQILDFQKKNLSNDFVIEKKIITNNDYYKNYQINFKTKIFRGILKIYNLIFSRFLKKNKQILYKTYLGKFEEIFLNLKFLQLPNFLPSIKLDKNTSENERNVLELGIDFKNDYELFIKKNIFKNLPKEFFENFEEIGMIIQGNGFPEKPKKIFTTRSLSNDNIFVRYVAEKKEFDNTELILGQHGGAYGHFDYLWSEQHEIEISDKFLTWGWKNNNKKVLPVGYLKNTKLENNTEIKDLNNCSYFLRSRGKFPHRLDSSSGSNQMSKYYDNCYNFFSRIKNENININISPRFHEAEFGWGHKKIWKKRFPNLDIKSSSDENMQQVINNYDLIIFSYIATGFLECLLIDKPFILVSSLKECPLRKEVLKDFNSLKYTKIFFESNDDAISHLKFLEQNLDNWWNDESVKKTRFDFANKYVIRLTRKERLNKIFKILS